MEAPLRRTWPCSSPHEVMWRTGIGLSSKLARESQEGTERDRLSFLPGNVESLSLPQSNAGIEVSTGKRRCLMLQHFVNSIGARLQSCCRSHLLGLHFSDAGATDCWQARNCTANRTAMASADWTDRWLRLAGWCGIGRPSVCCVTVLLCHHCWDAAVGLASALRLISSLRKPGLQKTQIGGDLQGGSFES